MNVIYKRQFAVLIFIAGVVFKTAFLPVYLSREVLNGNWQLMLFFLAFELILFALVYDTVKNKRIYDLPGSLRAGIMIILFVYFTIRTVVMTGEAAFFVSRAFFEGSYFALIVIMFGAVLFYSAMKNGRAMARLLELLIFLILAGYVANLAITGASAEFSANLPLFPVGLDKFIKAFGRYSLWTGDFLPLLFFQIEENQRTPERLNHRGKKRKKSREIPYALGLYVLAVTAYCLTLNAVFKADSWRADNLTTSLGAHNILNRLIGRADALSLTVWLIPTVLSLSLNLFAALEASSYFLKNKRVGAAIVAVAAAVLFFTALKSSDGLMRFARSAGYFMLAAGFSSAAIIAVAGRIYGRGSRGRKNAKK